VTTIADVEAVNDKLGHRMQSMRQRVLDFRSVETYTYMYNTTR